MLQPAAPQQEVSPLFYRQAKRFPLSSHTLVPTCDLTSPLVHIPHRPLVTVKETDFEDMKIRPPILPLLHANPEVVEMSVLLFLLLVPPLFFQHFALCLLQLLHAIRWQKHVG